MYTVLVILIIILIISFITGCILNYIEHKSKNKKLSFYKGNIVDEDVI